MSSLGKSRSSYLRWSRSVPKLTCALLWLGMNRATGILTVVMGMRFSKSGKVSPTRLGMKVEKLPFDNSTCLQFMPAGLLTVCLGIIPVMLAREADNVDRAAAERGHAGALRRYAQLSKDIPTKKCNANSSYQKGHRARESKKNTVLQFKKNNLIGDVVPGGDLQARCRALSRPRSISSLPAIPRTLTILLLTMTSRHKNRRQTMLAA